MLKSYKKPFLRNYKIKPPQSQLIAIPSVEH